MNLWQKLMNWVCYCGVTKEEYDSVKPAVYVRNFEVWKYLNVFLLAGYLFLAFMLNMLDGFTFSTVAEIIIALYLSVVCFLFSYVLRKESIAAQYTIYVTMVVLFLVSTFIEVFQPTADSVAFYVLLITLPMFTLDKPYFMIILLSGASAFYLHMTHLVKPEIAFRHNMVFTCFYCFLGIFINFFYNALCVRQLLLQKRDRERVDEVNKAGEESLKLNNALKKMSESTLELLGDVVEERNMESGEHIRRVKGYTYILANRVMQDLPEYHLDPYTVDLIAFASALHDVGKIAITDAILCKPGRLTKEEFEIMKTHCEKGVGILRKMENQWSDEYLDMSLAICLNHHEKWDGNGYPRGLKGDEIPIAAQIVSVADIYDALTTKRVYKEAYSPEEAMRMIFAGECGAFSEKLLSCLDKCRSEFMECAHRQAVPAAPDHDFELISKSNPDESFVIGLHDSDRNLREKLRLDEELSVMEKLSETVCYICYVNMRTNEVKRFKADEQFEKIIASYGDGLKSYEKFDLLLNSIIVKEDYDAFRAATEREKATAELMEKGHVTTDFRIRLDDGIHYCRMKLSLDRNHPDAVVIGISRRDEEHVLEEKYLRLKTEVENARREKENREMLENRLAVIECLSSNYDYVCTLNVDTFDVVVYRAADWVRDMFKNLEDIVKLPEVRDAALKGIIHPEDFEAFKEGSLHENVMKGLMKNGVYNVNYRAYKYGKLIDYQTRYTIDRNNPKRIIIGLHCIGEQ